MAVEAVFPDWVKSRLAAVLTVLHAVQKREHAAQPYTEARADSQRLWLLVPKSLLERWGRKAKEDRFS